MRTVYFIKPIGMAGPVKIGCSFSPNGRRETLEIWSPFPLEIAAEIEGDFDLERRFHAAFESSYQGREWFRASEKLSETIRAIRTGEFDLSSLPEPKVVRLRKQGRKTWTAADRLATSYWARLRAVEKKREIVFSDSPHRLYCAIRAEGVESPAVAIAESWLADPLAYSIPRSVANARRAEWQRQFAEYHAARGAVQYPTFSPTAFVSAHP